MFLAAVLDAHPTVSRGVLVDLPAVIEQGRGHPSVRRLAPAGRLDLVAADFFETVPAGIDVFVMKQVMHSWDDDRVVALLKRCRAASPHARLLAAEFVQAPDATRFVKNFGLVMTHRVLAGGSRAVGSTDLREQT